MSTPTHGSEKVLLHFGPGNVAGAILFPRLQRANRAGLPPIKTTGVRIRKSNKNSGITGRYCLIEQHNGEMVVTLIESVVDCIDTYIDPQPLAVLMSDPTVTWATASLTAAAYHIVNGKLDLSAESVRHDIENPDQPVTIYGNWFYGLRRRFEQGVEEPFTLWLIENGMVDAPDELFKQYALAAGFPHMEKLDRLVDVMPAMVDRVAPNVTPALHAELSQRLSWPGPFVITEGFDGLLILKKGRFAAPPWGEHIDLVDDLKPYTAMKKYLFSMLHIAAGLSGGSMGLNYIHEAVRMPSVAAFMKRLQDEASALLSMDETHARYAESVRPRMAADDYPDAIERIVRNSVQQKMPGTVLPAVLKLISLNAPVEAHVLLVSLFLLHLDAEFLRKQEPLLNHGDIATRLASLHADLMAWVNTGTSGTEAIARVVQEIGSVTGHTIWTELGQNPAFIGLVGAQMRTISKEGVVAAINRVLADSSASSLLLCTT